MRQSKGVGGVEEIGREALGAKGARERDCVVNAIGDRPVATDSFVCVAAHGEDLAAGGGEARIGSGSHAVEREEAEEDEMDQRNDEFLHQTARLFARDAADESRAALLDESGEARERIGARDTHVGVHEKEKRVARETGELMAGEVLAAPAGRQRRRGFEAHARIGLRDLAHDLGGAIGRTVVEHDHFELDAVAPQNRAQRSRRCSLLRFAPGSGPNTRGLTNEVAAADGRARDCAEREEPG